MRSSNLRLFVVGGLLVAIGLALFALLRAMRSSGDDRAQPTRAP